MIITVPKETKVQQQDGVVCIHALTHSRMGAACPEVGGKTDCQLPTSWPVVVRRGLH